ncbi:MAG: haloacid dehalogenase type II [Methanomicrobia archaeon]|nr:haloacid dehalogenase type II [Methanomicrobia archaeon]
MPEFELISFDCYGTLINWELGIKNALRELAEKKNISIDIEDAPERYIKIELEVEKERYRKYRDILTISLKRLLKEVELTLEEEKIFVSTLPKWPPFPETRGVLSELKRKGYKLAILSNIDEDMIKKSIDLIGIAFDCVVTAEQTHSYKPSHKHWKYMLGLFKIPKNRILHVAASYVHDIIPAHELGIKTAWINRNKEKREKIGYEFDNLKPLTEIL